MARYGITDPLGARRVLEDLAVYERALARAQQEAAAAAPSGQTLVAASGRLLTLAQVAGELGVSRRTVERRIREGRLVAFHDGRTVRVSPAELRRYITASIARPVSGHTIRRGRRLVAGERLW